MKLSAFLRQAKTVIEARGWIQDALETKDGVCTWGAIHRAGIELGALYQEQGRRLHFNFVTPMAQLFSPRATDSHATILEREALYLIAEATGQSGPYGAMNIPHWNNNRTRTKEDVLAAFDLAIFMAEEQEREDAA